MFYSEQEDFYSRLGDQLAENLSESRIQLHCLILGYLGAFLQFSHLTKRD
jgi:hypothetical protein